MKNSPVFAHIKGQLGVPLTVYPWYLLCPLGILGDFFTHKYPRDIGPIKEVPIRGTLGSGYIHLSPDYRDYFISHEVRALS